jgi:HEAT repeat protein
MLAKRRLVLGALLVLIVLGAGLGVWQRQTVWAWYQARQLSGVGTEQRQAYVTRFEHLGSEGVTALVRVLRSDDVQACQNAGFVLGKLLSVWPESDVRREAVLTAFAESLSQFSANGQAECLYVMQHVLSGQTEPSPEIVAVMARLLGQIGSNPEARQAALELTADLLRPDTITNETLLTQARAWVVAGLRDANPNVRAAAVRLAVVPALRAHDQLAPLVVGTADPSADVRQLILLALGDHEELLNTDDLCRYLHDESHAVRSVCERALRARGLSPRQVMLARLVTDPRPAARAEVPALVLQTPELDAVIWMEKLTRDPAPAVRAATARALGEEGDAKLHTLIRHLAERDSDPTVQEIARYFLRHTSPDR